MWVLLTMSNQEPFGNVSRSQAHVAVGGRRSAIAHEPICEEINERSGKRKGTCHEDAREDTLEDTEDSRDSRVTLLAL